MILLTKYCKITFLSAFKRQAISLIQVEYHLFVFTSFFKNIEISVNFNMKLPPEKILKDQNEYRHKFKNVLISFSSCFFGNYPVWIWIQTS